MTLSNPPRMALAHEWLDARAGSEKAFEALARIFPEADLFALVNALGDGFEAGGRPISTTLIDRIPGLRHRRQLALPLMPLAWRTVTRRSYDLVVTSSHACVKGFRPARAAVHLCYCYTPMRYVWDSHDRRSGLDRLAALGPRAALRRWDRRAARWVDSFAAISHAVSDRIERHYGRRSRVIHPPVDTEFYSPALPGTRSSEVPIPDGPFVLACSRFVPYKRLDLAILAADRAGLPIVVAGRGPGEAELRALAERVRVPVTFELAPGDERLRELYRAASVFVFPALEDFGIVVVEAQACGTPVVALAEGGTVDTVVDGVTGALVQAQDVDSFAKGILQAMDLSDPRPCIARADEFSTSAFERRVRAWVDDAEYGRL